MGIADHISSLERAYPNIPTECTERDINSVFRQIRLQPADCSLFSTEFRGSLLGVDFDIIVGYMALPFGWTGAPGIFASIDELITRHRNLSSPANVIWDWGLPFRIHSFVYGGALIVPTHARRLEQTAAAWEEGGFMVIGGFYKRRQTSLVRPEGGESYHSGIRSGFR